MVVMVTPPAFASIGYNTYTVFACINAFMVPCVFFFYPEVRVPTIYTLPTIPADPNFRRPAAPSKRWTRSSTTSRASTARSPS